MTADFDSARHRLTSSSFVPKDLNFDLKNLKKALETPPKMKKSRSLQKNQSFDLNLAQKQKIAPKKAKKPKAKPKPACGKETFLSFYPPNMIIAKKKASVECFLTDA